ncbi:MAG: hypothetical protein LBD03_01835 [Methanobrevibacter sp.]|jgi:hypothetical protein|nr:hypothetical protein [Candidatus Methanovirga procula]
MKSRVKVAFSCLVVLTLLTGVSASSASSNQYEVHVDDLKMINNNMNLNFANSVAKYFDISLKDITFSLIEKDNIKEGDDVVCFSDNKSSKKYYIVEKKQSHDRSLIKTSNSGNFNYYNDCGWNLHYQQFNFFGLSYGVPYPTHTASRGNIGSGGVWTVGVNPSDVAVEMIVYSKEGDWTPCMYHPWDELNFKAVHMGYSDHYYTWYDY